MDQQGNGETDDRAVARVAVQLIKLYGRDSCEDAVAHARQLELASEAGTFATAVRKEVERMCRELKGR